MSNMLTRRRNSRAKKTKTLPTTPLAGRPQPLTSHKGSDFSQHLFLADRSNIRKPNIPVSLHSMATRNANIPVSVHSIANQKLMLKNVAAKMRPHQVSSVGKMVTSKLSVARKSGERSSADNVHLKVDRHSGSNLQQNATNKSDMSATADSLKPNAQQGANKKDKQLTKKDKSSEKKDKASHQSFLSYQVRKVDSKTPSNKGSTLRAIANSSMQFNTHAAKTTPSRIKNKTQTTATKAKTKAAKASNLSLSIKHGWAQPLSTVVTQHIIEWLTVIAHALN